MPRRPPRSKGQRSLNVGGQTGQSAEELGQTFEQLSRILDQFGKTVSKSERETKNSAFSKARTFVQNAAFNTARKFGRETVLRAATDQFRLGGDVSFSDSVTNAALSAGSQIPVIGSLFGDVSNTLDKAGQRTLGITGLIARAGGKVDPRFREQLFNRFLGEENRAREESKEIDKLKSSNKALGQALTDTKLGELIDALAELVGAIKSFKFGFP